MRFHSTRTTYLPGRHLGFVGLFAVLDPLVDGVDLLCITARILRFFREAARRKELNAAVKRCTRSVGELPSLIGRGCHRSRRPGDRNGQRKPVGQVQFDLARRNGRGVLLKRSRVSSPMAVCSTAFEAGSRRSFSGAAVQDLTYWLLAYVVEIFRDNCMHSNLNHR